MTTIDFILNGQQVTGLTEWEDTEIDIEFLKSTPTIGIDTMCFEGDAAQILLDWYKGGCDGGLGVFEGVPLDVVFSCNGMSHVFKMYVDLSDEPNLTDDCKIVAKVKVCDSVEDLERCLASLSFDYLRSLNPSSYDDCCVEVPYIVEKIDYGLELAFLSFSTFVALYQTIEAANNLVKSIIDITAVSSVGDAVRGALRIIANAIFFATMLIYTINLVEQLLDYIYPPVRKHKGLKVREVLRKAIEECGYNFKENIPLLDCLVYLPSKPTRPNLVDRIFRPTNVNCVPLADEQQYFALGMLGLVKKLTDSSLYIKDGCATLLPSKDKSMLQNSTYVMPNIDIPFFSINAKDFTATNRYTFQTDPNDGWTVLNYRGTSFLKRYKPCVIGDKKKVLLNGINTCEFPVALGSKKTGLTEVEKALKSFLSIIDALVSAFGGNKSYANIVTNRLCMLKVENPIHSVPKLLIIGDDGKIKNNHRDILSAKSLADSYYEEKQEGIVNNITVPFCCEDIFKVLSNPFFYDCKGMEAEFTAVKWNWSQDTANISYLYEKKYTNNLKIVEIEQE